MCDRTGGARQVLYGVQDAQLSQQAQRSPLKKARKSGASAPAGNQPAEAKDRSVCNPWGRAGIRLLKAALPVMPLRIANIVMAAAL
jgi:hypothetical protein